MKYVNKSINSPVGILKLIASETGLVAILWDNDKPTRVRIPAGKEEPNNPYLLETERQLKEYFAGERDEFSVALDFEGTDFQKNVWKQLMKIPHGETITYGEIAKNLGNERASRAVGAAVGKNPISIIAPCHRVIGSTGSLTGFAGGLSRKTYLLQLESQVEST